MVRTNPLKFLEEIQYEYMMNTFGEIVDRRQHRKISETA